MAENNKKNEKGEKIVSDDRKKELWREYYDSFINKYTPDLKYRYAMTVHKAQGSQWNTVFVDIENIRTNWKDEERTRMEYTAVSRFQNMVCFI